ncbi:MAG: ABC transporter ATP-binding protein [Firmicutes bacterium]|nr:ABC transporter ATP-binding protein [Candidatus Fermentithermobacillaceae bacterium]
MKSGKPDLTSAGLKGVSSFIGTLAYCLRLSWTASWYYTAVRIGVQIVTPLLGILASFAGKYLVDLLAGTWVVPDPYRTLLWLLGAILAISLARTAGQRVAQYARSMHDQILNGKISIMVMDRALSADLEYFDNADYHDKLVSATRDSSAVVQVLWNALSCVSGVFSFLGAFWVMCRANLLYGVTLIAAAIPSLVATAKYTESLYNLSLEQIKGERKKSYYQAVALDRNFAQDMRLFDAGTFLKTRYWRLWDELFARQRNLARKRTVMTLLTDCLPEIAATAIVVDVAFGILHGGATVGDYALYSGLVGQTLGAMSRLSLSAMQVYDNRLRIANLRSLDKFQNRVSDDGDLPLSRVDTIEFDHVCFTYPGTKVRALDDISFVLRRGEKVAIVGLNGSGKSTLIKLLLRMYDPDQGTIRINGVDIKKYRLCALRANFSVYFQEARNYYLTLRENLTISDGGRPDDVDSAATAALRYGCCEDILEKASKGLDTSLTRLFETDGIELSAGQHQKLAIARAFFRRHTALILDEPSSNLDPTAERRILESIATLAQGKMAIFTSQRLSNVFLADRILVLEKGRLVEDGTHEELLKNRRQYAELFEYEREKFQIKEHQEA